jgi:hypothetical protein
MPRLEDSNLEEMMRPRGEKKLSQRQKTAIEYQGYVKELTSPEDVKKLVLLKNEKAQVTRGRLKRAAEVLGKELEITKKNDAIYFRLKPQS